MTFAELTTIFVLASTPNNELAIDTQELHTEIQQTMIAELVINAPKRESKNKVALIAQNEGNDSQAE
jgi:hypothetical protein